MKRLQPTQKPTFARLVLGSLTCLLAITPMSDLRADQTPKSDQPAIFTTRESGRELKLAPVDDSFQFVIFGDRTSGVPAGLKVLRQAVKDTNLLAPDLVMTVGDLVQGYNDTPLWLEEAKEYKEIMDELDMAWFPVAGNHDVYWRGQGEAPQGQHEKNYEEHFAPLWYTFRHKNAGFIVLYFDEGDPETNEKGFGDPRLQNISDEQLDFLSKALHQHASADHVFVFFHHPRWVGGSYAGSNWETVHQKFKDAGNVSAVFAGHIHYMRGDGERDGIQYFTLATTGGKLSAEIPEAGLLHHINVVRVRNEKFTIASLPVGAPFDPNRYTQEYHDGVRQVRNVAVTESNNTLVLSPDSSADGAIEYEIKNTASRPIDFMLSLDSTSNDWITKPYIQQIAVAPGESKSARFEVKRSASDASEVSIPQLKVIKSYREEGKEIPVSLPADYYPLTMKLSAVPVDYFRNRTNQSLAVKEARHALRIENDALNLADGPFTVEGWFNPEVASGSRAAVAKTQNSEFAIFVNDGIPEFTLHLDGKYVTAKAKDVIPTNEWTHIAGVFDGRTVSIYVNGKLAGTRKGTGKRTPNALPLFIGADPNEAGAPTRPFIGKIDEVRISGSALYQNDFTPERRLLPVADSILMLNLDRTFGPFILDQSNSAVHTTLDRGANLEPVLAP